MKAPAEAETAETEDAEDDGGEDDSSSGGSTRRRRRRRRPRSEPEEGPPLTPRTMIIAVGTERNQIAVLEDGELVEHYVAHHEDRSIVGNVYLGKVQKVLPGMEAAFVDIGEDRNAVLYAGEVSFDEDLEGPPPRIEKVLRSGQSILCQVTKDPMRAKGARLTTEISLAGRHVVLVPEAKSIGISRRLPDDERRRLRDVADTVRPDGYGLIVRTAALGAKEEDVARDVDRLVRDWHDIDQKAQQAKAPARLHAEPELVIRVVRDLFNQEVERVVVDNKDAFERIRDYIADVTPDLADRMEPYENALPLFEKFHVVEQIRKALDRRVWLTSGGHIVIDRTEAMTVIDVNTGRYVGKSTLEETVLKTNLEAAEEVAKQLRLRDIGGIIVIDFIDMLLERNQAEVLRVLKAALAKDKTRTQVFGISELGLAQMTRKKVSEGLLEAFSVTCETCHGWGIVLTDIDTSG